MFFSYSFHYLIFFSSTIQFSKENPVPVVLPPVKVEESENVTEEMVTNTLRRAISFHSSIQAHDGHWPGDYGGPMFLMPGLVSADISMEDIPDNISLTYIVLHGCLKFSAYFTKILLTK